jgi:hypothetical protein
MAATSIARRPGRCRTLPCRPEHAMRRISAPLLAADLLFRRTEGPAPSGQDPRRGTGGFSRLERRRRSLRTALPASWRLIDAKGIRCCYHGWQFAADGTILETPGEPAHSTLKDRLYHGAYPTHEYGGVVFAYMGPPDRRPPFPVYDSFVRPGYRLMPGQKYFYPCNWL